VRVILEEDTLQEEIEIVIKCKKIDTEVLQILGAIQASDKKIVGYDEGRMCLIDPETIFYLMQ